MIDIAPSLIAVLLAGCGGSVPPSPPASPCPQAYLDADGDGFGDPDRPVDGCAGDQTGIVADAGDCDDADPAVHPGASEICDGVGADEDCDGRIDDDDDDVIGGIQSWPDRDADGYGDQGAAPEAHCEVPADRSTIGTDCDDGDGSTFPGAAWAEDASACLQDADGDGWGAAAPVSAAAAGTDCNDTLDTVHPTAPDPLGDLVDQDCDGQDPWFLFDDFELGTPDPVVFATVGGASTVSDAAAGGWAHSGRYSFRIEGSGGTLETVPIDASLCQNLSFSYQARRDPTTWAGGPLVVEGRWSGTWHEIGRWDGVGGDGPTFQLHSGPITDPGAATAALRIRLRNDSSVAGEGYYVDDFRFACEGPDGDGDGIGAYADCDDASPGHWDDCGLCVDNDGDDYGSDCDLGDDCDDGDPTTFPAAADPFGDGLDTNCDGADGTSLFDDFELGQLDATVWQGSAGTVSINTLYVANGLYSLDLDGIAAGKSYVVTQPYDGACPALVWSYLVKRGVGAPGPTSALELAYDDGIDWVVADRFEGNDFVDDDFSLRTGIIDDPGALWNGVRIRLENTANTTFQDFYLDDFELRCSAGDADGDGQAFEVDCDDSDPDHWADCGACVDGDGDGYGDDCDLGDDCDDANPFVHPRAFDGVGDGLDASCNGLDGPGFVDDFESSAPDPFVWDEVAGDHDHSNDEAYSGTTSLGLSGDAVLSTLSTDTSACTDVVWSLQALIGADNLDHDVIDLNWWDGSSWRFDARIGGEGIVDAPFSWVHGAITDVDASSPDFRFQIEADVSTGDFHLDDLIVACAAGDGDGDGIDRALDCDDSDPDHWTDCGLCVDGDGDGYGDDCDLGADCDDGDDTVAPGMPDPIGDGLDTDCSGIDGVGIVDDFEGGAPAFWWTMAGSYSFDDLSGDTAVNLDGAGAILQTLILDTSGCLRVDWSYEVKRGPGTPQVGDDLHFEYHDGTDWVLFNTVPGIGIDDATFLSYAGSLVAPGALHPAFRVRIRNESLAELDNFFLDDVAIVCP